MGKSTISRPRRACACRAAEAFLAPASEMLLQAAFTASSDLWIETMENLGI
jgi:hypothetical protein